MRSRARLGVSTPWPLPQLGEPFRISDLFTHLHKRDGEVNALYVGNEVSCEVCDANIHNHVAIIECVNLKRHYTYNIVGASRVIWRSAKEYKRRTKRCSTKPVIKKARIDTMQ